MNFGISEIDMIILLLNTVGHAAFKLKSFSLVQNDLKNATVMLFFPFECGNYDIYASCTNGRLDSVRMVILHFSPIMRISQYAVCTCLIFDTFPTYKIKKDDNHIVY